MLKKEKGFTIIELVIIIMIIGILVAVTIPSYKKYKRRNLGTPEEQRSEIIYEEVHDIQFDLKLVYEHKFNQNQGWFMCIDGYQYLAFKVGTAYTIVQQFENSGDTFSPGIAAVTCINKEDF